jgi:hypothetical protein
MPTLEGVVQEVEARIEQSVSLVVARGAGHDIEAHKLHLATDAADGLRDVCRSVLGTLPTRTAVPYTATAELAGREAFVIEDEATLGEMADLIGLRERAATLPNEKPKDLDDRVQMYAVVVGDEDRVAFVKKADPVIPHDSGSRLFALGGEQLRRLDEPAFAFRPGFDLIVADGWVVVLSQGAFEQLYRDLGLIERHIGSWVEGITGALPMQEESVRALTAAAKTDSRMWRRLREIKARGHLAHVTIDDVGRYAAEVGIEVDDVLRDGELVFDPDPSKRFSFLHLLNEDVYKGFLTQERFEAQRKAST